MTEIPFLAELGDALEARMVRSESAGAGLHRRRLVVVAFALAFVLALAGIAVAHFAADSGDLVATGIACYPNANPETGDLGRTTAVVPNDGTSPVATCARYLRMRGTGLTACAAPSSVAVVPSAPASDPCKPYGLAALPVDYPHAASRLRRLSDQVTALEQSSDCIPPATLVDEVQQIIDRTGLTGWHAVVGTGRSGPCGSVTERDGAGRPTIAGALNASTHEVLIYAGPSRRLDDLLFGSGRLFARLDDQSRSVCYSVTQLTSVITAQLGAAGYATSVRRVHWDITGIDFGSAAARAHVEACASLIQMSAGDTPSDVVARITGPGGN